MLRLAKTRVHVADLGSAKAGMDCFNARQQLVGVSASSLLTRKVQGVQQGPQIVGVEREQPVYARVQLLLPPHQKEGHAGARKDLRNKRDPVERIEPLGAIKGL